jgi:hypothetical protein
LRVGYQAGQVTHPPSNTIFARVFHYTNAITHSMACRSRVHSLDNAGAILFPFDETVTNESETNKEVEEAEDIGGGILSAESFRSILAVSRPVFKLGTLPILTLSSHRLQAW